MTKCKNCGDWCKAPYKYCYHCNQEVADHPCVKCGVNLYSERWKTTCKSCYLDGLNSEGHTNKRHSPHTTFICSCCRVEMYSMRWKGNLCCNCYSGNKMGKKKHLNTI